MHVRAHRSRFASLPHRRATGDLAVHRRRSMHLTVRRRTPVRPPTGVPMLRSSSRPQRPGKSISCFAAAVALAGRLRRRWLGACLAAIIIPADALALMLIEATWRTTAIWTPDLYAGLLTAGSGCGLVLLALARFRRPHTALTDPASDARRGTGVPEDGYERAVEAQALRVQRPSAVAPAPARR